MPPRKTVRALALLPVLAMTTPAIAQSDEQAFDPVAAYHRCENNVSMAAHYNAAATLLYRWWGLFEAPSEVDTSEWASDLFAEEATLKMSSVDLAGQSQILAALVAHQRTGRISHHPQSIKVVDLGDNKFGLNAHFIVQNQPAGEEMRVSNGYYTHEVALQPDGSMRFTKLRARLGGSAEMPQFQSTFAENRARATIHQFQVVMDRLSGKVDGLVELVEPDVVFDGLIKTAEVDGEAGRKVPVEGLKGLADWFALGPKTFSCVSHVDLERFEFETLAPNYHRALAQFNWRATTVAGEERELHTPRDWFLVDHGEKYMRVSKSR